jgi:import inner membrane translocase subunit TIM17
MGGSFANWGLAFSCFDCSLQYVRKKVRCVLVHAVCGALLQLDATGGCVYAVIIALHDHLTCCVLLTQEDPWNAIWAGALTGGFLQLRHGLKSAAQSAAFGGFLLVRGNAGQLRACAVHSHQLAPSMVTPVALPLRLRRR